MTRAQRMIIPLYSTRSSYQNYIYYIVDITYNANVYKRDGEYFCTLTHCTQKIQRKEENTKNYNI